MENVSKETNTEEIQEKFADMFFDMWLENKNAEELCYNDDTYEE